MPWHHCSCGVHKTFSSVSVISAGASVAATGSSVVAGASVATCGGSVASTGASVAAGAQAVRIATAIKMWIIKLRILFVDIFFSLRIEWDGHDRVSIFQTVVNLRQALNFTQYKEQKLWCQEVSFISNFT